MLTILFYLLIAQKTPETAEGVESLGCLDNCMDINPSKTKVMQFSHIPLNHCVPEYFTVVSTKWVTLATYVPMNYLYMLYVTLIITIAT